MTQGNIPAGWYDDGQGTERWWDGTQWTDHTQPAPGDGGSTPGQGIGLDKGPGQEPPSTPSSDVTTVAPSGGYPQSGQPAGPGAGYPPQGGYGAPGQPGQPGGWQTPYSTGGGGGGKGKLYALIGGGVGAVVIVAILLFVLLGGGAPKDVAKDYVEGFLGGDCDTIELASNEALDTDEDGRDDAIDDAKNECEDSEDTADDSDGCDVSVDNEEIDGKEATVDYEIKDCDDDEFNFEGTISLVEESGDWRVTQFG